MRIFRRRFHVWYPENAEYPGGARADKPRPHPACAKLVGVGEGIFQHLHHRNDAGRLVFDAFDRRARFPQVREQKRHAAAAFESCSAEFTARPIDSILSSMRSRKQETSSPRWALPQLRNVGVAGWKRPERISPSAVQPALHRPGQRQATITVRSSKLSGSVCRRRFSGCSWCNTSMRQETSGSENRWRAHVQTVLPRRDDRSGPDALLVVALVNQIVETFILA